MRLLQLISAVAYSVSGRTVRTATDGTQAVRLAAFVTNLSADSPDITEVGNQLAEILADHMEVEKAVVAAPFQDPQINAGSVFTFTLFNDGQIIVSDSEVTPDAYNGYASKWKGALEYNPDVTKPIVVENEATGEKGEYFLDKGRFESVAAPLEPDEIPVIGRYEEGMLADTSIDVLAQEIVDVLNNRYQFMQLKLRKNETEAIEADPDAMLQLLEDVRASAAAVLSVPASRVVLASIEDGVVQFSVYPATEAEVQRYAKLWTAAVATEAAEVVDHFGDSIDYAFPPTALTGVTTTAAPSHLDDDSGGSNAGVVVGAVAGSIAGAGAVGAMGLAYRRRQKSTESSVTNQTRFDGHSSDFSPGGLSPNGLTNVDIRGELTPGAAAYRG